MEASFDKKIKPVLKKLQDCLYRITAFDTWITKAKGRISEYKDARWADTARLCEIESKLEADLDKTDDLENQDRQCSIHITGLPKAHKASTSTTSQPLPRITD